MVQIKTPQAEAPRAKDTTKRRTPKVKSKTAMPPGANSIVSAALENEANRAALIAKTQVCLREWASAYLNSNFDPEVLPENEELHPAVTALARRMADADRMVWGANYLTPGETDSTPRLESPGLDVTSFFFAQAPLQLAAGDEQTNG